MRDWKTLFVSLAMMLLLAACSTAVQPAATTAAEVLPSATVMQVVATLAPSATVAITPTEVVEENYCLSCHTDKDQLISTAKIEEVVLKESEGAG